MNLFPIVNITNVTNLIAQNYVNSCYSSGGLKFKMSCQGYISSEGSKEESIFFSFPVSRGSLHSLANDEWRNTLLFIHIMKYYRTIKKK